MNEYQDQETWYEVRSSSAIGWVVVSDHDTRPEADTAALIHEAGHPGETVKTVRVHGLGE